MLGQDVKENALKRTLLTLALLLSGLIGALSYAPAAHARPMFRGNSFLLWANAVHGAKTTFTVSNPPLGSGESWDRYLEGRAVSGGVPAYIGMEKGGGACPNDGYLYYFSYIPTYWTKCVPVLSGDYNGLTTFIITYYTSGGGGTQFQWITPTGTEDRLDDVNVGSKGETFGGIELSEGIVATFTGHKVWGSQWINNQWQALSNSSWAYQNNPSYCGSGNGCPEDTLGNPPQMMWHVYPSDNATGGDLWSCDYSSGTTCYLNS